MSDYIFLGNRASNVDVSPQFQTYSKVVIHVDDDNAIEVGNNTGRTLEIDNPFGTRQMAQDILNRLSGYQYQPYTADGALLNPASEIGDTISASTAYGMIFTRSKQFGRLMKTDISAPCDEEINHEYEFESPQERKFTRVTGEMRASIILAQNAITSEVARANQVEGQLSSRITQTAEAITSEVTRATNAEGVLSSRITQTATDISAMVTKEGGNRASFGWSLNATEFGLYSGNQKVFWVNSAGANVKGTITATSGSIGGFTINASDIRYNNMPWGGTQTTGIYIGTSGIQLGQNFKVSNTGSVTATNMTLTGTLSVGGQYITADSLRLGAERANSGYSSWNDASSWTSSNGSYCVGGAGYGYSYNEMTNNRTTATYLHGKYIYADNNVNTPVLIVDGTSARWQREDFYDRDGNHIYLHYLGT